MKKDPTTLDNRYINNKYNTTWQNMYCWFLNHTLPTPRKEKGYLLRLYEIEDRTQPPVDEVVGIDTTVIPPQSINASGSSSGSSGSCSVSMSGSLSGGTSVTTRTIKVYPKLKVALVLSEEGKLIYDVPAESIVVIAEDLQSNI